MPVSNSLSARPKERPASITRAIHVVTPADPLELVRCWLSGSCLGLVGTRNRLGEGIFDSGGFWSGVGGIQGSNDSVNVRML